MKNHFKFNHETAGYSALALLTATVSCSEKLPERPNILLIITDQQSSESMSYNLGTKYLNTPNMDYLAKHGVVFTNAYCANPLSIPSRTSMFTGMYPHDAGIQSNENKKLDHIQFPNLGTFFADAGYETGYTGKWHIPYDRNLPETHGFRYMREIKNNGVDSLLPAAATDFLNIKRSKPFLLVTSFVNPHNICEWARGQALPDGDIGTPPDPPECPPLRLNSAPSENETDIMKLMRKSYQATRMFPVSGFTDDKWRQYAWAYYRMIERTDTGIGQILAALRESGQDKNTIIVFLADHGDSQGAHRWNQKTVFYEESVNVPLIISHSGIKPRSSDYLVQTGIDLIPTLCDLAGIPGPEKSRGTSLKDIVITGVPETNRDFVVVSNHMVQGDSLDGYKPEPEGRMLRNKRFKYWILNEGEQRETLYDLQNDPGEMVNLAGDPEFDGDLENCGRQLTEWAEKNNDPFLKFLISPDTP